MPRWLVVPAIVLALAPAAEAAEPSVTYAAAIESPGSVARDLVPVRVRVSGGVADAQQAAFHVRRYGSWVEGESVRMLRIDETTFEAQMATLDLPNGTYRLEGRVWGEVPPYDPDEPRTFARSTLDLAVDNPPEPPQTLQATTPAPVARLGWSAIPSAEREDFYAYRVLRHEGASCPASPRAYRVAADVQDVLFEERVPPGTYCYRVAAIRRSEVTETIASSLSAAVRIQIVKGIDPPVVRAQGPPPGLVHPRPPPLGEGDVDVSDREFVEDLPYGSPTLTDEVTEEGETEAEEREAGVDPRRTPTLVASGLVLAVGALLLRRFLSGGVMP